MWPRRCASPRRIGIRACRTSSAPWRAAASRSSARSRVPRWWRSSRLGRAATSGRLRSGRGCGAVLSGTVGPWSARSAGVAAAIAIGDRTGLAQDDEERLQAAGTYHVIAISGGNIAILTLLLVGAAALAGRVAPRRRGRHYRRAAGLRPGHRTRALGRSGDLSRRPLPRRTAHRTAWALDQHPRRRGDARPVALADGRVRSRLSPVLWRDAWHPDWRAEAGVSSDAGRRCRRARAGLAYESRVARSRRARTRRRLGSPLVLVRRLGIAVATIVAATAAAEVVLAPISAALFGRMTCAGLVLNLAAIPLMTVVQAGSLAALGAWLVDPELARACGYLVHLAARGLVDSARLVDLAPWLSREVPPPAWGVLAAYYARARPVSAAYARVARRRGRDRGSRPRDRRCATRRHARRRGASTPRLAAYRLSGCGAGRCDVARAP